jgi:hypothetical protein
MILEFHLKIPFDRPQFVRWGECDEINQCGAVDDPGSGHRQGSSTISGSQKFFVGIAVRFARYENLDVWGFDFMTKGGNVDDLGNDVDDLLPFLNEFKGYLDDCG